MLPLRHLAFTPNGANPRISRRNPLSDCPYSWCAHNCRYDLLMPRASVRPCSNCTRLSALNLARFSSFQRTAGRSLMPGRSSRARSGSPRFTDTRKRRCASGILPTISRIRSSRAFNRSSRLTGSLTIPSKPRLYSAEMSRLRAPAPLPSDDHG